MARPRVLVCDDIPDLRTLLRIEFDYAEIDVVAEAGNGAEAIDLATEWQPDVILLDMHMPVLDGWSALPQLRRVAPGASVIVLSSQADKVMSSRVKELGAVACLDKAKTPGEIAEAVHACVA